MKEFMDWINKQIESSRKSIHDIGRGEYFAYVKVREYLLKNPSFVPSFNYLDDNHQDNICLTERTKNESKD